MSLRRTMLALALLAAGTAAVPATATPPAVKGVRYPGIQLGAYKSVISSGPLTDITFGDDLSCQVKYSTSTVLQVYPPSQRPGDCGTFLAVDGRLYAPNFPAHGGTATGGLGSYTPYTLVSQTPTTGTGAPADPYIVTTVVDAGTSGLRITEMDTYVRGRSYYRSDIVVSNTGSTTKSAILSRGADCYLDGSDTGTGVTYPNSGVGCVNAAGTRAERFLPQSGQVPANAASWYEAGYGSVWQKIGLKASLPSTCACASKIDNGIAVAWNITTLPPQGSVLRTVLHDFVNLGIVVNDHQFDKYLTCAFDPGEIPAADPRPALSCSAGVTPDTGGPATRCDVAAVGGTGGADAALACATLPAIVTCVLSVRPPELVVPGVPCRVTPAVAHTRR